MYKTTNPSDDLLELEQPAISKALKVVTALQRQEKIEEVLDNFDFIKVNKVMIFLNWPWASSKGVPSLKLIIERANELLQSLAVKELTYTQEHMKASHASEDEHSWHMSVQTGGFEATRFGGRNEEGEWENFSLAFHVSNYRTEEFDE